MVDAVLLDRDRAAVLELLALRPGLAVHVVLADQRLRLDRARRVLAEVAEAGLGDLHRDLGLGRRALLLDGLELRRGRPPSPRRPGSRRPRRGRRRCRRRSCTSCRTGLVVAGAREHGRAARRPADEIAMEISRLTGTFPVARWTPSQSSVLLLLCRQHVRPVVGRLLGGAGAALELALGGPTGGRLALAQEGLDRAGELLEGDQAAGVRAERVEAAAGGGEVVEPAEEVLRVGAAGRR